MHRPYRWRRPAIIWMKWNRKGLGYRRGWKAPKAGRTKPETEKFQAFLPRRWPGTSLLWYGAVLAVAVLVFLKIPARTGPVSPVTGPVGIPRQTSWLSRTLERWDQNSSTVTSWLTDGIPLAGLAQKPKGPSWHVGAVVMTALSDLSGVRLTSLTGLLQSEIPGLGAIAPVAAAAHPASRALPRPHGQDAVDPSLPGDHGRVWAELGEKPIVGIYQTHSHESFWPSLPKDAQAAYATDWSKTVVQVGWWLALDLSHDGVPVVQSRVDNMSQGLLASYNESYHTAKQMLAWYPSVHILLDIHRSEKPLQETTTRIKGVETARILLVVGSNKLLPNPYWHQNLELAIHVAHHLGQIAPGILEGDGIDMVPYRYNQQVAPGDILVEIGGQSNTLTQERYAARDLAEALALVVKDHQIP